MSEEALYTHRRWRHSLSASLDVHWREWCRVVFEERKFDNARSSHRGPSFIRNRPPPRTTIWPWAYATAGS